MADDTAVDDGDSELTEKSEEKQPAKRAEPKAGTPHMLLRIALGAAGLLLLVGFFLPWINIQTRPNGQNPTEVQRDLMSYSGMQIASSDDAFLRAAAGGDTQRNLLWLIPVFGLALTAVGFLGFRWSAPVGAALGVVLLGYGAVTVIIIFFQNTAEGLWLILGGAFLSVGAGAFGTLRAYRARKPAKAVDLKLSDDETA